MRSLPLPLPLAFGWRRVLFANWPVPADALASRLPDALDVHAYDGTGWLSIVAFENVATRPRGLPAWLGVRVPELNLRTYVTADGEPGTYFFSLDADSALAVVGARLAHALPYYYADVDLRPSGDGVRFESHRRQPGDRPADFAATYRPRGEAAEAEPGSLTEFLVERRRLYTESTGGRLRHTDVEHRRWPLRDVDVDLATNTLFRAEGFDEPDADPVHYYSPGVDVVTTTSRRVDDRERPSVEMVGTPTSR